jgi:hypothetical protein
MGARAGGALPARWEAMSGGLNGIENGGFSFLGFRLRLLLRIHTHYHGRNVITLHT